jgi:Ca-activated chloride channel family protein
MMRKVFIYLAVLFAAAVIVFAITLTVGRSPSLERELAHRSALGRTEPRSLTIPSLAPGEPEEAEPVEERPPPEVQQLTKDITVTRYVQEEAAMVLLLDGDALSQPGRFQQGLRGFFHRLPASVEIGLRSLSGARAGDCTGTALLRAPGPWSASELTRALKDAPYEGPRNISFGLEEAAADLGEVSGERAVVVVTGGDEGCGGTPCRVAEALQESAEEARIFTVLLRPPPDYSSFYGEEPPLVWQSRMECMAERGRGAFYQASSAAELEAVLLEISSTLQPNLTVRVLHAEGREVTGVNVEKRDAWGSSVTPSGAGPEQGRESNAFPAVFSLPSRSYDLEVRYLGQERRMSGLGLSPKERVEVQINFRAGELYVQPKDAAGEELVGSTEDFDCFWGVEVFSSGATGKEPVRSCAFPAYFVLEPGTYTFRTWMGESETWTEEVKVAEGETTVKSVVFRAEE